MNGNPVNVIMGLDQPEDYLSDKWARGAVMGRFAGRLQNPIQIEEKTFEIEHVNNVLLHSGSSGWHQKKWNALTQTDPLEIVFEIKCEEGNSGFPGKVNARVSYRLEESSLHIHYHAVPTAATPINMTNHAYFNLNPENTIGSHKLEVDADQYLELNEQLVPTGNKLKVNNTPFDFRAEKFLNQTRLDDYFVINQNKIAIASLYAPETGITMKTFTDQPGVVVFTPPHFEAICFETQKFSNTPNISSFPSTLIKAHQHYNHQTRFEFSVRNESQK